MCKNESFDIFIVAGQSNAEGCGLGDENLAYVPHEPIYGYDENRGCVLLSERFDGRFYASFDRYFADFYLKEHKLTGKKLLMLNAAVGGTGFINGRWGLNGDLYLRLIDYINKFKYPSNRFLGFLWHQGERDAIDENSKAEIYKLNLLKLIDGVRTAVGDKKLPFICGDFVEAWRKDNPYVLKYSKVIKEVAYIVGGYFVGTDGVECNAPPEENIHFSRKGCIELGRRYYEAFKNLL